MIINNMKKRQKMIINKKLSFHLNKKNTIKKKDQLGLGDFNCFINFNIQIN